jgi:hypothetical protein
MTNRRPIRLRLEGAHNVRVTDPRRPGKGDQQLIGRRLNPAQLSDHRDRLFRAACSLCSTREDAEDLIQETYASVLKRPRFVRYDDDIPYLMQVLRNTWINAHRNPRRGRAGWFPLVTVSGAANAGTSGGLPPATGVGVARL